METRSVEGKYDTLLSLKSKVSNLQGHNDELRSVLREVRYEATKAKVDLEKAASKVSHLIHLFANVCVYIKVYSLIILLL